MSLTTARDHLDKFGMADSVVEFPTSSATVELAAEALGVDPARIAKTISVYSADGSGAMLIVVAGDAKLSSGLFKRRFGYKPRMLRADDVAQLTGHEIGGVCPFGNPDGVEVWLDESLKRFDKVWPAAGNTNSAIGLAPDELERISGAQGWVDVANAWRPEPGAA